MRDNFNNNDINKKEKEIFDWISGIENSDESFKKEECLCDRCKFVRKYNEKHYEKLANFLNAKCKVLEETNLGLISLNNILKKELISYSEKLSNLRSKSDEEINFLKIKLITSQNNFLLMKKMNNQFRKSDIGLKKRKEDLINQFKKANLKNKFENLNFNSKIFSSDECSQITLAENFNN